MKEIRLKDVYQGRMEDISAEILVNRLRVSELNAGQRGDLIDVEIPLIPDSDAETDVEETEWVVLELELFRRVIWEADYRLSQSELVVIVALCAAARDGLVEYGGDGMWRAKAQTTN